MFDNRLFLPFSILLLMDSPALAQSSYPATIGSAPAPALGIAPGITLGIAAAATANDRPANSSAYGTTGKTAVAANTTRLRASTR